MNQNQYNKKKSLLVKTTVTTVLTNSGFCMNLIVHIKSGIRRPWWRAAWFHNLFFRMLVWLSCSLHKQLWAFLRKLGDFSCKLGSEIFWSCKNDLEPCYDILTVIFQRILLWGGYTTLLVGWSYIFQNIPIFLNLCVLIITPARNVLK